MKKYIIKNKKLFYPCFMIIAIGIVVIVIATIIVKNKETETEQFNNSIIATIEHIKSMEIDDYVLVKFPDNDNIISDNGKIKKSNGKKYNQFTEGYIIAYDHDTYAFKLTNGKYCASKSYDDNEILIDLVNVCSDYDIEYKEIKKDED